jgi:ferric-dicitrate binding protein FerR (iron transport regulator)
MTQKNPISEKIKIAIINYLSGKWDDCDSQELTAWLEESDQNRQLFGQIVDLWEADQMVRREKDFNPYRAWHRLEAKIDAKTSSMNRFAGLRLVLRYAAVFILALFLGGAGYYFLQKHGDPAFSSSKIVEYTTPYGSKTNLKLLDGSLVWLNAGTTLKYDQGFGSKNRYIELSGEAYFEVAKNRELPFIVKAKNVSVRAIGTKFNVKAYPEEKTIETILLEGSVKVKDQAAGKQKSVLLTPDQKAIYYSEHGNIIISVIENTAEVSWFTNEWVIKNKKLGELAKLLERCYNIDFTFNDERIKNYEFGGTIKDETIEQVLTAITYSSPLKYKIINNHVTLSIDEDKLSKYKTLLK